MKSKEEHIVHPIPPLYREDSRVLVLGSFPSVKSRETAFFYEPRERGVERGAAGRRVAGGEESG